MSWWRAISPIPPPGPLRILAWATLTNTVGMGLWLAGSALFLTRSLGLSTRSVGVGLTVAALVGLIASVPFGRLADRRDPRTLRAVLQLLQAVVAASYLLVDSVASFIVVAVFSALLATGNLAVRAALVAAVGGAAGRVPAFAILRAVANLGTGVGAALAGLALVADARAAYQLLVLGNAAAFALSAMLIMRLPPFPPGSVPAAPKRGLGPALRDAPFVAVGATSAVLSLHSVVLTLIIPLWVTSHTAAPTIMVAAVLVTNTVLTVLLAVRLSRNAQTATPAARTMRRAGLALAAAMLLFTGTSALPAGPTIALLLVATTVYTIGDLWHAVGGTGLAYDLATPEFVGEYQGAAGLLNGLAGAVGPALLTLLILDGGRLGWVALALLFAVTGLFTPRLTRWAVLTRRPPAPTPERPPVPAGGGSASSDGPRTGYGSAPPSNA
ncbi:MFS transporter [Salinispora pacifica]|uniref:MFS transporter n=1 Tax=Salinispora pacifica TaxID=351187 RepID=UPI00037BABEA|nr:MFS transporter [Salinispora pacifica]